MISKQFLSLLLLMVLVIDGQLPPSTSEFIGNPGVKARITDRSFAYLGGIIGAIFTSHVPATPVPDVVQTLPGNRGVVRLSNIRLIRFDTPTHNYSLIPSAPNRVRFKLQQIDISAIGDVTGNVNILALTNAALRGQLTISENHVSMYLDTSLEKRDDNRAPFIRIVNCSVRTGHVRVEHRDNLQLLSGAEFEIFKVVVSRQARSILEQLLCARAYELIDEQLNERFRLLGSTVSLAKLIDGSDKLGGDGLGFVKPTISTKKGKLELIDGQLVRRTRRSNTTRQRRRSEFEQLIDNFNLTNIALLHLDYGLMRMPIASDRNIEIESAGEISTNGLGGTPFYPNVMRFPPIDNNNPNMLYALVSDYVPNSLLYHGHRINLFTIRVDPKTPKFGRMMRTTCESSSSSLSAFSVCLGDALPTLQRMKPNKRIALIFHTTAPPTMIFSSENGGVVHAQLGGRIDVFTIDQTNREEQIGAIDTHIAADMKMKVTSQRVHGKLMLEHIQLKSLTPTILAQNELDDTSIFVEEIVEKMLNNMLTEGIPIPIHPLFQLQKTSVSIGDRSMLLATDFRINEWQLQQLLPNAGIRIVDDNGGRQRRRRLRRKNS